MNTGLMLQAAYNVFRVGRFFYNEFNQPENLCEICKKKCRHGVGAHDECVDRLIAEKEAMFAKQALRERCVLDAKDVCRKCHQRCSVGGVEQEDGRLFCPQCDMKTHGWHRPGG